RAARARPGRADGQHPGHAGPQPGGAHRGGRAHPHPARQGRGPGGGLHGAAQPLPGERIVSEAPASPPTLIIVSGMSGSGKSVALATLEDMDFYCVDNLPAELLPQFVRSATGEGGLRDKLAVGIDVRNRHSDLSTVPEWLSAVGALGLDPRLVFFDTTDRVLLKRYAD